MSEHAWFERAFDRVYLDLYAHRDESDAKRAIEFLGARGLLREGSRVLDLCCGNGRHSEALEGAGLLPVGLDLSMDLLRDFHERVGERISKVRGDMRQLPLREAFDLVVNLFTSFGYFDDNEENWRVIREAHRVLKLGGTFVLDFLNAPLVRENLVPKSQRDLDDHHSVIERREITEEGTVVKHITLLRDGETLREWEESVRLLDRRAMVEAMHSAGFGVVEVFGDFEGSVHTPQSERLILVASKG